MPSNKHQTYLGRTIVISLGVILLSSIFYISRDDTTLNIGILAIPFALPVLAIIFMHPRTGLWMAFVANYFVMGVSRYLPGHLGLTIDGLLVVTWLALIFSQFNHKVEWKKAWNSLTIAAIIWYSYTLFQLANPEAVSHIAWFYAMRGVSLYMLLTIPLVFILFDAPKHLHKMLTLWAWFTLAGVVKGLMQKIVGPDPWEQHWLDIIGWKTHILPGGLRIFSFFTDAATYGGSMGYSGVVFSILALHTRSLKKKLFYGLVAMAAFTGMLISGTRGALAVPIAGFALYALLSKRIKMLAGGILAIVLVFVFLKYTTIGNSVYEIRRFRTALDPDNPSLVVRKKNQKLLKTYLADKPFGGGIGSAGNWGLRFSPDTFLAKTPTDSWYVQIWAEQGRIGLWLHIGILLFILFQNSRIILFRLKTDRYKFKGAALCAGMFGIMVASYGSGALGQMPNGLIVYTSMSFIFMLERWEKREISSPAKEVETKVEKSGP